jgi:hypothetical protein
MRREWRWALAAALALLVGTTCAEAYARLLAPYYVAASRLIAAEHPWTVASVNVAADPKGPGKVLRLTGFFRGSMADKEPAGETESDLQVAAVVESPVVFWTVLALWPLGNVRRRVAVLLLGVPVFLGLEAATTVCQLLSPLAYGSAVVAGNPDPSTWWQWWSRFLENGGRVALALTAAILTAAAARITPRYS